MIRSFMPVFAVCSLIVGAPSSAHEQQQPMRILVTNDDGVHAKGLAELVAALQPLGEVVVSAPAADHSGGSQAVTLFTQSITVETLEPIGTTLRYAIHGTPADSVIYGLLGPGSEKPFDLVVSGINKGENVGNAVPVSGTVGAARQAAMLGVRAIAVSQQMLTEGEYDYKLAAQYAARLAARIHALGDEAPQLVSINVPTTARGVAFVPAAGNAFEMRGLTRLPETDGSTHARYRVGFAMAQEPGEGGDAAALADGMITVTVLNLDPSDHTATGQLCMWAKKTTKGIGTALAEPACPR